MNISIRVTGGTDKTVRLEVFVNDERSGELQMDRVSFTRFSERLLGGSYTIEDKSQEVHQEAQIRNIQIKDIPPKKISHVTS